MRTKTLWKLWMKGLSILILGVVSLFIVLYFARPFLPWYGEKPSSPKLQQLEQIKEKGS